MDFEVGKIYRAGVFGQCFEYKGTTNDDTLPRIERAFPIAYPDCEACCGCCDQCGENGFNVAVQNLRIEGFDPDITCNASTVVSCVNRGQGNRCEFTNWAAMGSPDPFYSEPDLVEQFVCANANTDNPYVVVEDAFQGSVSVWGLKYPDSENPDLIYGIRLPLQVDNNCVFSQSTGGSNNFTVVICPGGIITGSIGGFAAQATITVTKL